MASSEEALKTENARLVAEMASMKKKIMAAVKKQQAELQAKVQLAEQRALAAETAAASATSALLNKAGELNGDNRCLPDTNGSNQEQTPAKALSSGLDSVDSSFATDSPHFSASDISSHDDRENPGDASSVSRMDLLTEIERLKSDLEEEKRKKTEQENAALAEKQRLELEIGNLKETIDGHVKHLNQVRESYESDLGRIKQDAAEQEERLKKENEKLENQLLQAATQVSEAFVRISSTQEEMERAMREANEARHSHANLLKDHERACEELEVIQTAILQAKKDAEIKAKVEVVLEGVSEQKDKATLESLLVERAGLTEQLHERTTAFSELERHAADLKDRLSSIEEHNAAMLKVSDDKSLVTIVSELQLQNELLIAQLQESQQAGEIERSKKDGKHSEQISIEIDSCEKLADLRGHAQESIATQLATEDLVEQLRTSLAGAEQRADNLTLELTEVQRQKDEEIKTHEEKYADLDMKFGKLQKRAKQRIQELQKEKDDVETQLSASVEKVSQTSLHCNSLQHDLDRVRAQAGDALRSLDAERQQLRNTNNRQREVIEDLHKTLEMKEHELKEVHRGVLEKDQMVHELTDKLMEMEETQDAAIADLASKHQKLVEDLKAQLADAVQERTKAAETVSSLQMQLAEKESQVAELDAASSGEAVRLTVSLDAARKELMRIEQEHRDELEVWNAKIDTLKEKLEESEKACLQQELAAVKARSQMETELQSEQHARSLAEDDLSVSREQVASLEKEFAAYKVRAYSLLQKKEAELSAAKDVEQLATQEAALKEAQKMAALNAAERDRALKALQDAAGEHESQLAARSIALLDAQQKIRELATKVESTKAQMLVEQEAWQSRVDEIDETWQAKYDSLRSNINDSSNEHFNKEITSLRDSYVNLKGEHEAFREMANSMVESKDHEIARLLEEIREIQTVVALRSKDASEITVRADIDQEDPSLSSIEIAEQQILLLARQQAQREEELGQCRRHIQALQDEIVELEHENRLHTQQESALKEELRISDRSQKREGVDLTYLKNVILKLLETGEVEALLPVISMLLQFSPEELRKCQEVYNTMPEVAVAAVDSSAPRTLLSRFMFSKAGR